jgi:hypothetical protein
MPHTSTNVGVHASISLHLGNMHLEVNNLTQNVQLNNFERALFVMHNPYKINTCEKPCT